MSLWSDVVTFCHLNYNLSNYQLEGDPIELELLVGFTLLAISLKKVLHIIQFGSQSPKVLDVQLFHLYPKPFLLLTDSLLFFYLCLQ